MLSAKNTLHIIDTLWLGGAQTVLKGLFENNAGKKNMHLFALRNTREKTVIGHPNIVINSSSFKLSFPIHKIRKLIKEKNIEIVHCHLPKSQLMGLLLSFLNPGIKLVFHEQGDIIDPVPLNLPVYILGKKRISQVIACSNLVKEELSKKTGFPAKNINVIYNYVNFKASGKSENHKQGKFKIGFAGRLIKRKGWRDFISVMHLLKSTDKEFEIHLAGDGPDYKEMQHSIEENELTGIFNYHGFVKNMAGFYKEIDLLVVPSHWEPMGMVHVEAMAFGVPVIASDVPGMNEVLSNRENCLLFEPGKPEMIKERILEIIANDELRKNIIEKGQETAGTFSLEYFEEELGKAYEKLF
ncbi:MAG: glycosyltransferase family 4 protein [Bacteroidetes bacterium]|nr:glycosyltransferase family 4 protein [Bacteroidota bacterium]